MSSSSANSTYHLDQLIRRLNHNKNYFVGYPTACDFSYSYLKDLLNYPVNNIGDAFDFSVLFSSHDHEKRVIEFMMDLYHTTTDNAWGYIASCSSECILYSIWRARNYLTNFKKNIVCITSDQTHYATPKAVDIANIPLHVIKSDPYGQMDLADFEQTLKQFNPTTTAIIIVANIGSTVTSAIDDFKAIRSLLTQSSFDHYIHADAAFDGMFLPFLDSAPKFKLISDFDSINISGHKFIGAPMPCGILLIDKKYLITDNSIEYIKINDMTLGGSRNGIAPVILYEAIRSYTKEGLKDKALKAYQYAQDIVEKLQKNNIDAWKNPYAITIVIDRLADELLTKWHMPSTSNYSALTALPKLTESILEQLITDILNYNENKAFDLSNKKQYPSDIKPLI